MAILPENRDLSRQYTEARVEVRCRERQRLDLFLLRELAWKSRSKIRKLIDSGWVAVNGQPVKVAQRVGNGDVIVVRLNLTGEARPAGSDALPAPFWEDPYLLAVNKPAARLVHPVGRTVAGTIINELHHRYRDINERGRRAIVPKLCHRLDRDTSGVLLVAKTDLARRSLQNSFDRDEVAKEYLAIVEGIPEADRWTIDLPIMVNLSRERQSGNRLAQVHEDGKPSRTDVEVLMRWQGYSVLRCRPKTGRQNQIRAHLAAAGHPILGDVGYGSEERRWNGAGTGNAGDGQQRPYPGRPLLHSWSLTFPHPVWRTAIHLGAPPPEDFQPFINGQREREEGHSS